MAWIQKTIPPPSEVVPFRINNFSGGLNNKSSDGELANNEAFNLLNMSFFKDGLMEKRKGIVRYIENKLNTPILFQDIYKPINGEDIIIQATNNALYLDFVKTFDIKGVCDGVNYLGKYYFVNSENIYILEKKDEKILLYKIINPPSTKIVGEYKKEDMTFKVESLEGISVGMEIVVETLEGSEKIKIASINSTTNEITMETRIEDLPEPEPIVGKVILDSTTEFTYKLSDDVTCMMVTFSDFVSECNVYLNEDGTGKELIVANEVHSYSQIKSTETPSPDKFFINSNGDLVICIDKVMLETDYELTSTGIRGYLIDNPIAVVYLEEPEEIIQYDGFKYDVADSSLVRLYVPKPEEYTEGVMQYDGDKQIAWYEPCVQELDDPYKGEVYIPEKPSLIELNKDRIFVSGCEDTPHMVYVSDVNNTLYFPSNLPLQVPPNSDEIVGLKYFHSAIIIFRKYDVHVLYGNTNRTDTGDMFRLKLINTHTGSANNDSIQIVHNYLFYLGSDGIVYMLHTPQTNTDFLSTKVVSKEVDLFKEPISFVLEDLKQASTIFYNNEYWLSIKDKILIYNYDYMAWTMYNNINATSFLELNGDLIIGTDDGKTMKFGVGYSDDYLPYTAYWVSKRYDFGIPSNYKQFKELYIIAHVYDEYVSNIKLDFEIDYVNIRDTPIVKSKLSLWAVAQWGDRFITRNIAPSLPLPIGRRGRVIRFMYGNGYTVDGIMETYQDIIDLEEYIKDKIYFVKDEKKCYTYNGMNWVLMDEEDLYQPLRIYEINGDYEVRSKR